MNPETIQTSFILIFVPQDRDLVSKLFDHFIRSREHVRWYRQADLLRRLEIDYELEFPWLLDRQVSRLGALQDLINVSCHASIILKLVWCIRHEPTDLRITSVIVD